MELYKNTFLNKLPKPIGDKIKEYWINKPIDIPDTLGGMIRTCETFILEKCTERQMYKQRYYFENNRICCNRNEIDIPGKYGCQLERPSDRMII